MINPLAPGRRKFIEALGGAILVVPFVGSVVQANPGLSLPVLGPRPLTVAQIIAVSWSAVLREMHQGQPWASRKLNQATSEGRISFQSFGPSYVLGGKNYAVEQVFLPVLWSQNDEDKNPTTNDRIVLTRSLITNGVNAHEDHLSRLLLPDHKLVVSKRYRRDRSETFRIDGGFYFVISTVFVQLPLEGR